MNNYKFVDQQIETMKSSGMKKCEIVQKACELCLGWSYVFGGYGQYCSPANRKSFAERSSCPSKEAAVIKRKCQVLNGSRGDCTGCNWYPGGNRTRFFDCRGFTRWILLQVGISIDGSGCTSQWNTDSNWVTKGKIEDMPMDAVCCVFQYSSESGKMEHTGIHIGGGTIIHCSGEVKYGKTTDRGWTHFAIPNGMDGDVPVPTKKPTIRKGSTGAYVVECQNDLIQLGYDLSPYGADGKFGAKTETAVKQFQKSKGLTADGVVGQMTWAALDEAVDPQPTTKLFTVTIPHQKEEQCKILLVLYPGSTCTEE